MLHTVSTKGEGYVKSLAIIVASAGVALAILFILGNLNIKSRTPSQRSHKRSSNLL